MLSVTRNNFQLVFLLIAVIFFMFLGFSIFQRNQGRDTVLGARLLFDSSNEKASISNLPTQDDSKLQLQDFHRVEMKNGKPIWEVRAQEARFFPAQSLTYVNGANVVFYREDGSLVKLKASSARLLINGENFSSAELDGEIEVLIEPSLILKTDVANFNADKDMIIAPGVISIVGDGYEINGEDFELKISEQAFTLKKNVKSKFYRAATVPSIKDKKKKA
jgi:LPS export ABC transporter protein LptC